MNRNFFLLLIASLPAFTQSVDTPGHPQNYASASVIGQAGAQTQVLIPALPTWGAANSIIKDPKFGNRILRVTDTNTFSSRGFANTDGITSPSAESSEWNADGTMFWATSTVTGGVVLFDFNKATFQASIRADTSPSNVFLQMGGFPDFSFNDKYALYGAPSLTFLKYDILSQTFTTLFNFSTAVPGITGSAGDASVSATELLAAPACGPQQDQWTCAIVYEVNSPNQYAVLDFTQGIKGFGASSFTPQTTGPNWNPAQKIHNVRIGKEGRYVAVDNVIWDLQTNTTTAQGTAVFTGHKAQGYNNEVFCGPPPGDYGPQALLVNLANANSATGLFPQGLGPTFYGPPCDYASWQDASSSYSIPFIGSWETAHGAGASEIVGFGMITAIRTDQVVPQIWEFAHARSPNSSTGGGPLPVGTSFAAMGTVTTSGTAVSWASGTPFITLTSGFTWPGMAININGTSYTISAVTDSTHLTLTTSAGTHSSPVPFLLSHWITVNAGGSGYAVNDTGTISGCGTADATYKVLGVSSGSVVSFSILSGGRQYTASTSACTTTATSGAGTGFKINTSSILWNFFYSNVRAQVSQDGKYALFNSIWEGGLSTDPDAQFTLPRVDVFIVELTPLTPQFASTIAAGSTKAVFNTLAPDAGGCMATVYNDSGRTLVVTSASDTVRDIRSSQILLTGLAASTHYWTSLSCGVGGLWVIKSDFFTRAAGSGTYNFTFDFNTGTAMRYSSAASMSSPTNLPAATRQLVPVGTDSVIYAQVGTTGPITILVAP